jgi:hypothetical protein
MMKRLLWVSGHVLGLVGCMFVVVTVVMFVWERQLSHMLLPGGEALVLVLGGVIVAVGMVLGSLVYYLAVRGLDLATHDKRSLGAYLRGDQPGE